MYTYHYAAIVHNGHLDSIRQVIMMMAFYRDCKITEKFWRDYFGDSDTLAIEKVADESRQH